MNNIKKLIGNATKHFMTIIHHKIEVLKGCCCIGLYWQGIVHDLSKFSPIEFVSGIVYYQQGTRSPISKEREIKGYSLAWLHHKGHNRHHFEYWIDASINENTKLEGKKMPPKFVAEMAIDRIAAAKIYERTGYTDRKPLDYLLNKSECEIMNLETYMELKKILTILAQNGEREMYQYIRTMLMNKRY